MKAEALNGITKPDAKYLSRVNHLLREIKTVRKEISRERAAGRKVSTEIRRQHHEIRAILDRVEATL